MARKWKILGVGALILALSVWAKQAWFPSPAEPVYQFVRAWGESGSGPGQFQEPIGLTILIENRSVNTGENIQFTRQLLQEQLLDPERFILVQKPYMERRAIASFEKQWPEKKAVVTSPPIPFEQYPTPELPLDLIINIMVGDLQRIAEYPALGYQTHQEIPAPVWEAYHELVRRGFSKHLLSDSR